MSKKAKSRWSFVSSMILTVVCLALLSLASSGCRTGDSRSDLYFLPSGTNAMVSFEGVTQEGKGIHRLEVRRLAYISPSTKHQSVTQMSCVIYYAGDEYGPVILLPIEDCIAPLVKKASNDMVEIYFTAGAHTHIRQRWQLLGYSAKLMGEEAINWQEDPRMKDYPRE